MVQRELKFIHASIISAWKKLFNVAGCLRNIDVATFRRLLCTASLCAFVSKYI